MPPSADAVYILESLMFSSEQNHLKVILGHVIFCVYSSSRFGDTVVLGDVILTSKGEMFVVETASKRYKNGAREREQKFLSLIALGFGLYTAAP